MSYLDIDIIEAAKKYSVNGVSPMVCYKRFLDDIFMVWLGTHAQLHSFHRDINKIKSSIKFTMEHSKTSNDNDPVARPRLANEAQFKIPHILILFEYLL